MGRPQARWASAPEIKPAGYTLESAVEVSRDGGSIPRLHSRSPLLSEPRTSPWQASSPLLKGRTLQQSANERGRTRWAGATRNRRTSGIRIHDRMSLLCHRSDRRAAVPDR